MLTEQWQRRCFCANPGFWKLLSFDFRYYGDVPAELYDSELVWRAIIGTHFSPLGEWAEVAGEPQRTFRCPQCGSSLLTRSEQYSINMWPSTSRPTDARRVAEVGFYVVGIRSLPGFDFGSINDFRVAESVQEFVTSITGTP